MQTPENNFTVFHIILISVVEDLPYFKMAAVTATRPIFLRMLLFSLMVFAMVLAFFSLFPGTDKVL